MGEAQWYVVLGDGAPRFFCAVDSHFAGPFDTAPLAARTGRCLAGRLRNLPRQGRERGQRFLVERTGGVEIAIVSLGCAYCEAGQTLALFVHAPRR